MNAIDLVIFDCDGVLVDSEKLANEVLAKVILEETGLVFSTEEMYRTFVGRSRQQCMDALEGVLGSAPPPHFESRYNDDINQALLDSVLAVNGIERVLESIDVPFCVASSGTHEKMRLTLGKTGLLKHFEGKINSTSDVERSKPHPDVYLHAARRMGVSNPGRCLVIEDSPTGIQGGVAAGMTVFGYAELMDAESLRAAGAHHIFDDMHALLADIESYFG